MKIDAVYVVIVEKLEQHQKLEIHPHPARPAIYNTLKLWPASCMFSSPVYIFPAALETNILPLSICGSQFIPFFASPVIKAKTVAGGTIPQTCRRALCSTQNRNIHPL